MGRLRKASCAFIALLVLCTAAAAFAQALGNVEVDMSAAEQSVYGADDSFIQTLENAANSGTPLVFTGTDDSDKVTVSIRNGRIKGTASAPIPSTIGSSSAPAVALMNASVFNLLFNSQQTVTGSGMFVNSIPDTAAIDVPIYVEGNFKTAPSGYDPVSHKLTMTGLQESFKKGNYLTFARDNTFTYAIKYYYRIKNGVTTDGDRNSISWNLSMSMTPRYTVDIAPINIGGTPALGGSLKSDALADYAGKSYAMGSIADLGGKGFNGMRLYGSLGDAYTFTAGEGAGYYVDYVTVKTHDPVTGNATGTKTYKGKDAVAKALAAQSAVTGKTEIRVAYMMDNPYIKKESNPVSGSTVKRGDTIVYTLLVRNTNASHVDATVKDVLPAQVTPVSYTVDGKTQPENWAGSWTGALPPKNADGTASKVVIAITTKVNATFSSVAGAVNEIKNKATLTYTLQGKQQTDESEETVHYLIPNPGYTLTKERVTIPAGGGFAPGGGVEILYTATLTNTGDVPLSINLTDAFAQTAYFTFLDGASRSVQLPADDTATAVNEGIAQVSFRANTTTVAQVGNHLNTVTATSSYGYTDPITKQPVTIAGAANGDPLFKTATALTPVVAPNPGLGISKTVNGAYTVQVTPGAKLTYVLTLSNTGNVRLTNIAITDTAANIIESSTLKKVTAATTAMGRPVTISNLVINALDAGDRVTLVYTAKCSDKAEPGVNGNNVVNAKVTYASTTLTPEAQATITVIKLGQGESTIPRTGDDTNFTGMYVGMGAGILLVIVSLIANRTLCSDRVPWRRKRR